MSSAARLHMTAKLVGGVVMSSGIYQITNQVNGKCYIGSAVNLKRRWQHHLAALRCGGHSNLHLQRAFDKDGEEAFVFEVFEEAGSENLIAREQYYLDTLKPEYNFSPTAGSPLGYRHTEDAKRKLKGRQSPMYGKHHSVSARAKLSNARKGKLRSEDAKQKTRAWWTPERRQVQSDRKKGKRPTEEHRRKLSEARNGERNPMYGKHHSEETKRKISITQKARWRRVHEEKEDTE